MAVKKRPKTLSHGRPPITASNSGTPRSLTSKATRTLIRTHHRLQKQQAAAIKIGDQAKANDLKKELERNGGLELYQAASIKGQSAERGGDSSRVLVDWLKDDGVLKSNPVQKSDFISKEVSEHQPRLNVLEVGALSTTNAISRAPGVHVTRIDLHSQDPGIQTQDFMKRPLPSSDVETFDILSLSLVLNYVPDAVGKGAMLRRTCSFLRKSEANDVKRKALPALFLVLPAPCITNSRYLTEEHLKAIMESLGYKLIHRKLSPKLVYYLWRHEGNGTANAFPKKKINDGKTRNNFSIVLE